MRMRLAFAARARCVAPTGTALFLRLRPARAASRPRPCCAAPDRPASRLRPLPAPRPRTSTRPIPRSAPRLAPPRSPPSHLPVPGFL